MRVETYWRVTVGLPGIVSQSPAGSLAALAEDYVALRRHLPRGESAYLALYLLRLCRHPLEGGTCTERPAEAG